LPIDLWRPQPPPGGTGGVVGGGGTGGGGGVILKEGGDFLAGGRGNSAFSRLIGQRFGYTPFIRRKRLHGLPEDPLERTMETAKRGLDPAETHTSRFPNLSGPADPTTLVSPQQAYDPSLRGLSQYNQLFSGLQGPTQIVQKSGDATGNPYQFENLARMGSAAAQVRGMGRLGGMRAPSGAGFGEGLAPDPLKKLLMARFGGQR
jgi:hypothetical protein